MRDGLAREFPEALRAVAWTRRVGRRPVLWAESVVWAAISGIGAGFLVSTVAQALAGLTTEAIQATRSPIPFSLLGVVTVFGTAAATAVTLGVGGFVAFALYVGYLALGLALAIPGLMTFCERSGGAFPLPGGDQCTALGFITSLWPQLVGIGLGIAFARSIEMRGHGINSLLRIAGGFAIAQFVAVHTWGATVAQTTNALTSGLTIAAGMAAAAVAAGVIAAQLPASVRNAAIVAGIWLVPWLTVQLPYSLQGLGPTVPAEFVAPMLVSIAIQPIAAAFMVLSAAVAARARFIPRDVA